MLGIYAAFMTVLVVVLCMKYWFMLAAAKQMTLRVITEMKVMLPDLKYPNNGGVIGRNGWLSHGVTAIIGFEGKCPTKTFMKQCFRYAQQTYGSVEALNTNEDLSKYDVYIRMPRCMGEYGNYTRFITRY